MGQERELEIKGRWRGGGKGEGKERAFLSLPVKGATCLGLHLQVLRWGRGFQHTTFGVVHTFISWFQLSDPEGLEEGRVPGDTETMWLPDICRKYNQ